MVVMDSSEISAVAPTMLSKRDVTMLVSTDVIRRDFGRQWRSNVTLAMLAAHIGDSEI